MELQEAKKIADMKKREKIEEKKARYIDCAFSVVETTVIVVVQHTCREKVKEEIAKDRAERKAKAESGASSVATPQLPRSTSAQEGV